MAVVELKEGATGEAIMGVHLCSIGKTRARGDLPLRDGNGVGKKADRRLRNGKQQRE